MNYTFQKPTLTVRGTDQAAELIGDNRALITQCLRNRQARRLWADTFPYTNSLLIVDVLVDGEVMHMAADALVVRHFIPETATEKWAIQTQEAVVVSALKLKNTDPCEYLAQMAFANELLWLTITGNMRNDKDRANASSAEWYKYRGAPTMVALGTWNVFEPTL